MSWVQEILGKYNLGGEFKYQQILLFWDRVIGDQLRPLTRALRFTRGTLTVEVASPSIAQELSFLKERYITRLNDLAGEPILCEIRFIPGRFQRTPKRKLIALGAEERAKARAIFSSLPDPHLRHSFERLYVSHRRQEETLLAAGGKRCPRCGVVFYATGSICPGCQFDEIEEPEGTD
jgi:predicted Zn-ribbon and HTH transcriptional regulator